MTAKDLITTAPESGDSNIDKLRKRAERLVALLGAPEPGLFTWHEAVANAIEGVAEFSARAPALREIHALLAQTRPAPGSPVGRWMKKAERFGFAGKEGEDVE